MTSRYVYVTVRFDDATYRAWKAEADKAGTDVGVLLAHAAVHSLRPRSPKPGRYRRLDAVERAAILAERSTSSIVLAARYGVTGQTIRNVWKAGR